MDMHYWYSADMHRFFQRHPTYTYYEFRSFGPPVPVKRTLDVIVLDDGAVATAVTGDPEHAMGWTDVVLVGLYPPFAGKRVPATRAPIQDDLLAVGIEP